MKISIIGPNLRDQSKGCVHVHAKGCGDIAKMAKREPEYRNPWDIEAQTRVDAITAMCPPEDFDYDETDPQDLAVYEADFHFFPCCSDLS